jgi:hypothetical protein
MGGRYRRQEMRGQYPLDDVTPAIERCRANANKESLDLILT